MTARHAALAILPTATHRSPPPSLPAPSDQDAARQEDEVLVARARQGDRLAMRRLIERHQRSLYRLAIGLMKDHEDAMDVVQDAFVKIHQNLPQFKGDSAFFTWAYRITYNLCIDALRKGGRAQKVEIDERTLTDEDDAFEPWSARSQSPQKAALRGELGERLQRALATLSENHRAILLLREVDGLSYEELAETLGIPKGTVMSRLFHARQKMQAALRGYLHDDVDDLDDEPLAAFGGR